MHGEKWKTIARWVLAAAMVAIGITHFVAPAGFVKIVPKALPEPLLLVYVSGFFEIAGGLGVLVPRARRAAGLGLVLLYLAVFPANVNMAIEQIQPDGMTIPAWALWLRLPFQIGFMAWAWWCTRPPRERAVAAAAASPHARTRDA